METTKFFGMGYGGRYQLYCEIVDDGDSHYPPHILPFMVINGGWEGVLNSDTNTIRVLHDKDEIPVDTFKWNVPNFYHYNDALEWLNGGLEGDISKYVNTPKPMPADWDDDIAF